MVQQGKTTAAKATDLGSVPGFESHHGRRELIPKIFSDLQMCAMACTFPYTCKHVRKKHWKETQSKTTINPKSEPQLWCSRVA